MSTSPEYKIENFWYMMQVLAAGRTLEADDGWAYRRITREYSIKFGEPLSRVRRMPFEDVLLEVLESRLDSVKRDDLIEFVRELLTDEDAEKRALEERMKRYEEEEKKRLSKQAAKKTRRKKQRVTANVVDSPKMVPVIQKKFEMGDPDENL